MTEFELKAKEMCEYIIQHFEADIIYQSDPFEYCYKLAKATLKAIPLGAEVKTDACENWQKEKPNKPCLFVFRESVKDNDPQLYDAILDRDEDNTLIVVNIQDDEFVSTMDEFAEGEFLLIKHYYKHKKSKRSF